MKTYRNKRKRVIYLNVIKYGKLIECVYKEKEES